MPAYNFQRQFVKPILEGDKPHTIRRRRKRPTKVGDVLYMYTGLRTKKARRVAEAVCVKVEPVIIYPFIEKIIAEDGEYMSQGEIKRLALADGFETVREFFAFFREIYEDYELDDFEIIHWDPKALKEVRHG